MELIYYRLKDDSRLIGREINKKDSGGIMGNNKKTKFMLEMIKNNYEDLYEYDDEEDEYRDDFYPYLMDSAIQYNLFGFVKKLIMEVEGFGSYLYDTHIYIASRNNNLNIIKYLISKDFKVTSYTLDNVASTGNLEILKYLIGLGIKPNVRTILSITPYKYRIKCDEKLEILKYLETMVVMTDKNYRDMLNNVITFGYTNIFEYILSKGIKLDREHIDEISKKGELDMLKLAVDKDSLSCPIVAYEMSYAAKNGHLNMVKYMLSIDVPLPDLDYIKALLTDTPDKKIIKDILLSKTHEYYP